MEAVQDALADRTALMLYGSETGNAQDIAEELGRLTERLRFDTQVSDLNSIHVRQLLHYSVILIAISTTGQGDLPANSQTFWKSLRSVRLRPGCLQSVRFASFGLGDTSYLKFNWAHRKLYNRLVQLGAQPICDRGEADEQHPEGVDGSFLPWSLKLRQRLLQEYPLPDGIEPIPDDVLLEPKWVLDFLEVDTVSNLDNDSSNDNNYSNGLSDPSTQFYKPQEEGNDYPENPPEDLLTVPDSIVATVLSNTRLTPPTHWQDVRHLILNTSTPHPYNPGDTLTIYPKNFPSDVAELLKIMKWASIADSPLKFVSSSSATPSTHSPFPLLNIPPKSCLTLRSLLTNHLDIMSIPRRSFFTQLAHYTNDPFHRERLLEFTNPDYIDELYDYTTRPRRSILEVLQEFESVQIPWQRVCSIIPVMRGRQFSIASGGRLKSAQTAHSFTASEKDVPGIKLFDIQNVNPEETERLQTRIELLIAIVKYRTVIKRTRQGVCTRYVSSLRPGQRISVTLQKGGLGVTRADGDRPVVMVGPGTGVAPMRALIYERLSWKQETNCDRNQKSERVLRERQESRDILFFGCRNSQADFFFKNEWDALQREEGALLDVYPAFSRDQRNKVYVQDLVRSHASQVYKALADRQGLVYICGSSGKMPQAVRESLIEVFQQQGGRSRDDAEAYLVAMEKNGRYKQETW
ncbi:NADPH dependent diflavin oxidoreductase-like protein 1 [Lepidopterella palustris CBS 459.81]|uniref:NADPH-dependent diflavin oxidoreductase 1 n=1 Tax=Lepidopterella palustris CBS 459.81 TaxID=1314670 RepID=A0A8E2EBW3_9PEZI|nr:NADPH dependent diflavin oxidoreductase-like protein 1 [Lepidopterella palustris CBS 459.81]